MPDHGLIGLALEEALTDVVLLEHRHVRTDEQASGLTGQAEGPAEGRKLAIDRGVTHAVILTMRDVLANRRGPNVHSPASPSAPSGARR